MHRLLRTIAVFLVAFAAAPVFAAFHLWQMTELYSNADGSVQFLELTALSGGQQFLQGHTLASTSGQTTFTLEFERNLPGDTSGRRMLIGTQGFAALGIVTPDFIVPNGFFFPGGGRINFAEFSDVWDHPALPSGNLSLSRDGSTSVNSPINFFGQVGTVPGTTAPPPTFNVQALWWGSPAGSGNGWGVNITHQGDVLFATWFTYDLDGSNLWLSSDAHKTGNNTYTGQLYLSRSAPFNAYDATRFRADPVGSVTFTFTDGSNGTFDYTLNGTRQTKAITKFLFGPGPVPTCTFGGSANGNYQDLWWGAPAGSQNGWGVNIAHQGDILFATWFTYGTDGSDLWMVMDNAVKVADRRYSGTIYQTRSAPWNAYDSSRFVPTAVGTGVFQFTDDNTGTFTYTVNNQQQSKQITRYVFSSPVTVCSFSSNSTMPTMPGYPLDP
jgi:hypothetical protein